MSRFDLSKGERFSLKKSEGLNNLTVTLSWDGDADLDISAFLVGEDGLILDDADFVFYGSAKRSEPFDPAKFGNKNAWKNQTVPVSADGSVMGSHDERTGGNAEKMEVDLSKVGGAIKEIIFCSTIFTDGKTFGDIQNPVITVTDVTNGNELCSYRLDEQFTTQKASVAASLAINSEYEWEFKAESRPAADFESLIEIYAG